MPCNTNACLISTTINNLLRPTSLFLRQSSKRSHSGQPEAAESQQHSWSILKHLCQKQLKAGLKNYASLLLNISDKSFNSFARYKFIWDEASFRVAVDGSADCLARRKLIHSADVVCGDFDSIDPHLVQHLRSPDEAQKLYAPSVDRHFKMPQVIETPNQKETDFTKALRVAESKRPHINHFICLYNFDGVRLDHLFGILNTLHLVKKYVFVLNIKSNTVSWLLPPGRNIIQKMPGAELCSLVPFTGAAEVKTAGLEYEIGTSTPLNFGGLISTSNICKAESESIVVETNRELLWSIDLHA